MSMVSYGLLLWLSYELSYELSYGSGKQYTVHLVTIHQYCIIIVKKREKKQDNNLISNEFTI